MIVEFYTDECRYFLWDFYDSFDSLTFIFKLETANVMVNLGKKKKVKLKWQCSQLLYLSYRILVVIDISLCLI